MRLPDDVREFFQKQGATGGKKRARNMSPHARVESARRAAQARWAKKTTEPPSSKKNPKKSGREV